MRPISILHIIFYTSGGFLTAWSAKLTLQSEVQDQESRGGGRNIIPFTDLGKRKKFVALVKFEKALQQS